jgi:lysophospholipase L1-like esterase
MTRTAVHTLFIDDLREKIDKKENARMKIISKSSLKIDFQLSSSFTFLSSLSAFLSVSLAFFIVFLSLLFCSASPALCQVQTISGYAFEDHDGDGIFDTEEPALIGIVVQILGKKDSGESVDESTLTNIDGFFSFTLADGCYVVLAQDPEGWRFTQNREDGFVETSPNYNFPVGQPRFAKMDQGIDNLKALTLRFTAMGDSIAWNWNSCFFIESFWYSKQVRSRIACTAPSASVTLDEAAVKGEHTDELLIDDNADLNNVFEVIAIQPELVTISMIGNDLLGVEPEGEPSQAEINKAAAEVLDARQNLQEALSSITSEVHGADIALNTLYDNLAYDCYSSPTNNFHRTWIPIIDRILRDLAWGQNRRASISEVAAEFAHEDQAGNCTGFDNMICRDIFQTDNIHPNNNGYQILREKVWEAIGGTNLGPKDAIGRTSIADVNYGFLRKIRRILPSNWETRNGASVADPEAAFNDQDGGLPAQITLGINDEEFRLNGFPDWYDEIQIVRVIAGVRYRTTGTVTDDFYRMEASITGQFRPDPGHAYVPTDWNFYTPIVGGGGPNQPPENPDFSNAVVLVIPNVTTYRDVSAMLNKNPTLPGGASDYEWPAINHVDLSTTSIRATSAAVAGTPGNDNYQIELDAAWLDLYGWEKTRPSEVQNLLVNRLPDGTLEVSFDPLAGAQRYNLYFGRVNSLQNGGYDHGHGAPAGPKCDAVTEDAGGGRLKIVVPIGEQPTEDTYILVTAHVDDVESPAGYSSENFEIDRSESICR